MASVVSTSPFPKNIIMAESSYTEHDDYNNILYSQTDKSHVLIY